MDYAALKTEIQSGPLASELAPHIASGNDQAIADALNRVDAARLIDRTIVPAREIIDATVVADWTALNAAERLRYQTITGAGEVNLKNPNVRASFQQMFPTGSATRTALLALQRRSGSRAEEIADTLKTDSAITPADIAIALRKT
jgi:hypothetical protein